MKTKNTLLLLIIACGLFLIPFSSKADREGTNPGEGSSVNANSKSIVIESVTSGGETLRVLVEDETGSVVYDGVVNTDAEYYAIINSLDLASGTYEVIVKDKTGVVIDSNAFTVD